MGVQGHICELQLVPAQVFKVKSDGGHKNYIRYRNLRGA
eukprot:CAMPEP_0184295452 /NCGR_PEP_ID=MMETSP1049-20130417/6268_1 /TAXON_ID=77928 /ORGANISM="Proteomonas sulcata, Strain CCMP704" /LENGTH=38 /DNA_ID= /DNA_START= /DNA_END= /DNA_ORIENTATION=